MLKLAERLFHGGEVSSTFIMKQFSVSFATAKRDLIILEQTLPCVLERKPNGTKVLRLSAAPAFDHLQRSGT